MTKALHTNVIDSPIGPLRLTAADEALQRIDHITEQPDFEAIAHPVLHRAAEQLREYFAGARRTFDLPLDPKGTEFQRRVWDALHGIPCGQTLSYGQLAERLGDPKAVRAVGRANGKNPLSIVVPCHRVIGGDSSLTGYAGGLERKRQLLELEGGIPAALFA